jgi:hypothetical protein
VPEIITVRIPVRPQVFLMAEFHERIRYPRVTPKIQDPRSKIQGPSLFHSIPPDLKNRHPSLDSLFR